MAKIYSANKIKIPNWHEFVLQEREELIKDGKAEYIDLNTVKISIKKELDNQKKLHQK